MVHKSYWLQLPAILWIFTSTAFSKDVSSEAMRSNDGCHNSSSCDAQAVHDELMKVIDIVKANTYTEHDATTLSSLPQQRKFQEDEDYANEPLLEFPSVVPMVFKLINSALSLNSTGLVEGSFGLLPENFSNRVTNVLGLLATSILGPGATTTPRPRRRRRTTTTVATTQETTTTESPTTTIATTTSTEPTTIMTSPELRVNGTSDIDSGNSTEITEESEPVTSTDVLFKESALGELPVYAAAYAPNYVAATTPYPVYANQFLHALYPAPTTPTVPTTTTASTTTSTTSTDPNSYAIALPFDYMEGGLGPAFNESNFIDMNMPPNVTYLPPLQITPPEYMEYEYEEQTEEAVAKFKDGKFANSQDLLDELPVKMRNPEIVEADQGKEEVHVKTNSSLGRISRLLFLTK